MDEEINVQAGKTNLPGTGEQYLDALIRCADWVPTPYKKLAALNKARPEVMKELYLCACDGIPAEKAEEAQEKRPPEGALRFLRRKYIQNETMGDYTEELTSIKATASYLEKEVKQMSETLQHIADHVPNFDAMFPERVLLQEKSETEDDKLQEKEDDKLQEKEDDELQETEEKTDSGLQKIKKKWAARKKQKGISYFMEEMMEKGYGTEQVDYLLTCLEEGLSVEQIRKFASPKLPIDVMQRLRMLEERKEIR